IIVIGDTPLPELAIQANNTATCSQDNGSVTLSTSNGTGNMTYIWQGLSTTGPTATGLAQGNYQVTVTDAAGCTDTITVTVDDAPSPTVSSITPTSSTCGNANGQIVVVATGGSALSYAWSAAAVGNSANANDLTANTYTVTVSDANNCTATASAVVDNIAGPNLQVTNITPDFCNQNNGSISVNATNGTPIYSYTWSNTSIGNTDSPTNLAQGNYTVTVTDNNQCTATLTATINPTAGPTLAATDVQDAACGQATGSLSVTPSGGNGTFSYQWTNNVASNNSAINLLAGTYTITVTDGNNCTATTTATVNDLAAPALTINNSTNTTCGLSNGAMSVSVNGGAGGNTFQWSHDISVVSNTANSLSATTYTITVTDANNCSATTSATLTDSPAQTLSEGTIVNANCGQSNGSAQVLVNGGATPYNYLWDNGQTNATATNLAASTYTVTVTDNNQCTAVLTLAVTNLGAPTITVNNVTASTCGNSNGAIDISASGGTGTLSYAWDNQAVTEDINNLAAGTYGVTVTDSGNCQAVEAIVIDDNPSPTLTLTGMTTASCGQNDGSLTVAPTGGSGTIDYLWNSSPAQNTPTATNLATGTYTVTITDDNNCTTTLSATVDPADGPVVVLNQTTNATCGQANGSVSVVASGGEAPLSYSWSNDNALNSPSNINLPTGNYTVTVTDNNGCTISLVVEVPTENGPSVSISDVTDATCGEENGELVASVSGGVSPYSYSWSNNSNNNSPTNSNLAVGSYIVTITDNNNCIATASGTISMANGPAISIDSIIPETCGLDNGAISITVNGGLEPYTIVWNNGANGVNISNLDCNNSYTVTVTDANGCTQTTEVSVACFESPTVAVDNLVATTCGDDNGQISVVPIGGTGQIDYQWSGGIATNASQVNNLSPDTYTVTITDDNGCTATTSGTIDPSSSPILSEGAIVAAHCGLADGSASVNVVDGTSPYNFVWDNTPQISSTITNVSAGSYQVTVTDAIGCIDELGLTVGNANGPTGVVVDGQALCGVAEGSLTVNVNGGITPYSYSWDTSPVQTDATAINLFPGDYSVTVTDASGCTFVANGTVIGSLPPTV
ncbi:MAG TPA: hypothetical protein PK230_03840, partial [Chitinophagales bacterium]|nr:hypothetical protein [Chitinophagales bacterium]